MGVDVLHKQLGGGAGVGLFFIGVNGWPCAWE